MKNYTEREIKGLCKAYQVYNMIYDKDKENIPADFINEMKNVYTRYNTEITIESPLDINDGNISEEGLKYIAYMYLFIKNENK